MHSNVVTANDPQAVKSVKVIAADSNIDIHSIRTHRTPFQD